MAYRDGGGWLQVSIETREVMAERDQLAEKVRSLEAEAARASQQRRSLDMEAVMGGEWKPLALVRKLAMKHEELKRLQVAFLLPEESAQLTAHLVFLRDVSPSFIGSRVRTPPAYDSCDYCLFFLFYEQLAGEELTSAAALYKYK